MTASAASSSTAGDSTSGATAVGLLRRPWVWVLLAGCVIGMAGLALRFAPLFAVEHVDVLGNAQVSADEVIAAAQVSDGAQLLSLPVDDIESRIESLDAVAGARVVRDWPDRVKIVVHERRPIGFVPSMNGAGLIGSDGSIYREQAQAPDDLPLLPTVQFPAAGGAQVGASYAESAGETENAVFAVASGLPRSLQRRVESITASSPRSVQLTFAGGVIVEWGSAGSAEEKATVISALRERRAWGRAITAVDVTAPEAPAWN